MDSPGSVVVSPWLGEIQWNAASELHFPAGLPGFEKYSRLVPVEIPSQRPLVYLQSAENPEVCFIALPVLTVNPRFGLALSDEDRALLELDPMQSPAAAPAIGTDVMCLALLVPSGTTVKTNLDAPIVINLHNGRGVQAISPVSASGSWRLSQNAGWEALC